MLAASWLLVKVDRWGVEDSNQAATYSGRTAAAAAWVLLLLLL
jgi:hypothetical protein